MAEAPTFTVTSMLEDGTVVTETGVADPPLKGDSFEYEHSETRVGQVVRVESEKGEEVTELGDTHHELVEPDVGDDLPDTEELAADPVDEENPPTAKTPESASKAPQSAQESKARGKK